ncbi:DMT family transporter [Bacillus sp. V3B]|uniref:DMT family transporter n=1 Tax=Bacillus sp. V3B TaxID=2804915 RepID=UPI00210BBB39|nr:DMT family transporter [Bacillus sp. V3B]MCQ6277111.1 DMT family transporter [Bacillus sp. V3B]
MRSMKIYIILLGLMVIWGFNISILKLVVENIAPITVTAFRIFIAAVTVFLILGFTSHVRFPRKKEWGYILAGSCLSVVFHHYLLAEGLTKTSATNAGLILGMGPLLTVLLSMLFFKKRPTIIALLGFILGGTGVSVIVLFGSGQLQSVNLGDLEIFIAILSQAGSFILINKAAKTMDSMLLTSYMLLIGSFVLFAISLWVEPNGMATLVAAKPSLWVAFILSGILATGVGQAVYNRTIGQVGAAESSIFLNLSTFFSVVGAAVLLNETIIMAHFIGLLLIVSGVLLGSGALESLVLQRRMKRKRFI